ncbi:MAG: glycosyltransferase, partial [Burkholderiaceae bacterium]
LQPSELTIVSSLPNPFGDGAIDGMTWQQLPGGWATQDELPPQATSPLRHIRSPWVLAVRAGASLQPHALLEFAISARDTTASLLYADDDLLMDGKAQYPNFKPHTNTEWLRSTNYLGDAVLIRTAGWKAHRECHRFEGVYARALQTLEAQGRKGLLHIDTLLVHGSGQLTDDQLSCEARQLQAHLARSNLAATVSPGNQRGLRNVSFAPAHNQQVSVVVPSATQTGYLVCLLQSMVTYPSPLLHEVIVVTDNEFADRVQHAVNDVKAGFAIRVVSLANSPYSHAKALNAGAAQAAGDVLLFADDDTEITHNNWLEPLCGYFCQADVAAVAPRLFGAANPDPV